MATWKSSIIVGEKDIIEDYVEVDCFWEYQTTSDSFTYYEILKKDHYGYTKTCEGQEMENVRLTPDCAERLYHALANWMKRYNSEDDMKKAMDSNYFE